MYKLYVVLRSDLESMTPGKAAAQVAHAASQCAFRRNESEKNDRDALFVKEYDAWADSAIASVSSLSLQRIAWDSRPDRYEGFGTTIVLDGGDLSILINPASLAPALFDGVVRDPGYPVRDGLVTHSVDIVTCYWAFDDPEENPSFKEWASKFSLYDGPRLDHK